jgi:hypothetical protein
MSFTKYPMKPMTAKPMATALQMCRYSGNQEHVRGNPSLYARYLTFLSGFCAPRQELQIAESKLGTFSFEIAKTDLASVTDELLGNLDEFIELVGHVGQVGVVGWRGKGIG